MWLRLSFCGTTSMTRRQQFCYHQISGCRSAIGECIVLDPPDRLLANRLASSLIGVVQI